VVIGTGLIEENLLAGGDGGTRGEREACREADDGGWSCGGVGVCRAVERVHA